MRRKDERLYSIWRAIEVFGENKIELFARQYADGWDCWGNETPDEMESD